MTNKKIVLTRPQQQSEFFLQQIIENLQSVNMAADAGDFLIEPMMKIENKDITLPDLANYDGVITTSLHARKIIPANKKCYNVGDYADTARELTEKIINENKSEKRRFLYLRGKDISFDIKGVLEAKSHIVDEIICYEARAVDKFSQDFLDYLSNNNISAISFFSKRTANIFIKLVYKYKIIDDLRDIKVLCISNSMLECCHSIFGNNIEVSSTPDALGMLEIVKNHY